MNESTIKHSILDFEKLTGESVPLEHYSIIITEVQRYQLRKPITKIYPLAAKNPAGYKSKLRRANIEIHRFMDLITYIVERQKK